MEDTIMKEETLVRQHTPRNVNRVHEAEIAAAGFNTQLAVWLTEHVGTMWTAYGFAVLAIIGLFAILGLLSPLVATIHRNLPHHYGHLHKQPRYQLIFLQKGSILSSIECLLHGGKRPNRHV